MAEVFTKFFIAAVVVGTLWCLWAKAAAVQRDQEAAAQWQRDREATAKASAEAWERGRPARDAAAAEAWERGRPAREAAAAAAAADRARLATSNTHTHTMSEEARLWKRLQTRLGEYCDEQQPGAVPVTSARTEYRGAARRMGYFRCPRCKNEWRSNDSWKDWAQACPACGLAATVPFLQTPLDHGDEGIAEVGFRYWGAGKSFGRFNCKCGRVWVSAHAWKGETQQCHACHRPVGAWWQEMLRAGGERRVGNHHDVQGCSKCKKLSPQECWRQPATMLPPS